MNTNRTFRYRLKHGATGGVIGGLVFGMMMAKMGMLPMIGKMVGAPNVWAGWGVHLLISAGIGSGFGIVIGSLVRGTKSGLGLGAVYGMGWWLLGPLTLMPLFMGMGLGVNWNAAAAQSMLPSLMGHAIFGLVMGFVYSRGERCVVYGAGTPQEEKAPRSSLKAV